MSIEEEDQVDFDALESRAIALFDARQFEEAARLYSRLSSLQPDNPVVHSCLGNTLKHLGRIDEALIAHERAVDLAPETARLWANLGGAHLAAGQIESAVEAVAKAVGFAPADAEMHFNLGTVLHAARKYKQACAVFERALELDPNHAGAHLNWGSSLKVMGNIHEAVSHFAKATNLDPNFADAQWNLSLGLLAVGMWEQGWERYEWRREIEDIPKQEYAFERWDGQNLPDKRLLLHAEQGFGDTFQFVRYAHFAKERVGSVTLACQPPLVRVLSGAIGVDQVVPFGGDVSNIDIQLPLLSVPAVMAEEFDHLADGVPYLNAERSVVEGWEQRLNGLAGKTLRIGLCWQGNPKYKEDYLRSVPLSHCETLWGLKGTTVFALQKDHGREQISAQHLEAGLHDLGPYLDENAGAFVDTAAVLQGVDVLITSDTGIAHLAGSMGVRTWLLLATVCDWRWGFEGQTTPWYPTMRVFRQREPGDWGNVIARVVVALEELRSVAG